MHHISLTPFGRQPVTPALLQARRLADKAPALPKIDKWALFNDLRTARAHFGQTDRSLAVLYALLSFLPDRMLQDDKPLVVFPSNASLSDRAHGMAESTLRRHLATLVQAGLIWRQDSPNGKRFARQGADGPQAFGFDLRPLLVQAVDISGVAAMVSQAASTLRRQREVLVLRLRDAAKLLAYGVEVGLPGDWPGFAARLGPLRGLLRRQIDAATLGIALAEADDILRNLAMLHDLPASEMNATAAHSGRHYHNSNKDSSESEPCPEQAGRAELAVPKPPVPVLPLQLIAKACPDILPYAQRGLSTWHDLVATAATLRGIMGISADAWDEAQIAMGPETAAITVSAILQRFDRITNPGGYLRSLSARARGGTFSPGPMIMSLLNSPRPTALPRNRRSA